MGIDNRGQKNALSGSGMSVFEQLVPYELLASAGILQAHLLAYDIT